MVKQGEGIVLSVDKYNNYYIIFNVCMFARPKKPKKLQFLPLLQCYVKHPNDIFTAFTGTEVVYTLNPADQYVVIFKEYLNVFFFYREHQKF